MKHKFYAMNLVLGVLVVFQIVLIRLSMLYSSDSLDIVYYVWIGTEFSGIYWLLRVLERVIFYGSFVLIMASWGCYLHITQFSQQKPPHARTKLLLWLCISQMLVSLWYLFTILMCGFSRM